MSGKKQQPKSRKRQVPKSRKLAAPVPPKPAFTPRQLARLLADAVIGFKRNGMSEQFDGKFDKDPASLLALTALAGEPDHWLAGEFSSPVIGLSDAVSMLAGRAEGLALGAKSEHKEKLEQIALRLLEEMQQSLSWMFRTVAMRARIHALRSHGGCHRASADQRGGASQVLREIRAGRGSRRSGRERA